MPDPRSLYRFLVGLVICLAPGCEAAQAAEDELATAASHPRQIQVDAVVVVVGDRVVTLSDIALERIIVEQDPGSTALCCVWSQEPLENLVDSAIIRAIAGDISLYQPTAAQVRQRMSQFVMSWPERDIYEQFLALHGLDQQRLKVLFFSRLVVERYISRNLGPPPPANSSEAAAYMEKYQAWTAELRSRSPIRWVGGSQDAERTSPDPL